MSQYHVSYATIVEVLKILEAVIDGHAVLYADETRDSSALDDTLGLRRRSAERYLVLITVNLSFERINQLVNRETTLIRWCVGRQETGKNLKVDAALLQAGNIHVSRSVPLGKIEALYHPERRVAMCIDDNSLLVQLDIAAIRFATAH